MKTSTIIKNTTDTLLSYQWIKGDLALDLYGKRCMPDSPRVRSLDLMGMLWRSSGTMKFPKEAGALLGGLCNTDVNSSYFVWSPYYLISFNDNPSTVLKDVVSLLDAGLQLALQIEGIEPEDYL